MSSLAELVRSSKRVYLVGNGGSAANAIHICNDLLSQGIRAYTLDHASLTRTANDHDYASVFSDWLEVVGEKGDLLIALSGSGKSPNILKACETAERIGMTVWRAFGVPKGFGMQDAEAAQLAIGHYRYKER